MAGWMDIASIVPYCRPLVVAGAKSTCELAPRDSREWCSEFALKGGTVQTHQRTSCNSYNLQPGRKRTDANGQASSATSLRRIAHRTFERRVLGQGRGRRR